MEFSLYLRGLLNYPAMLESARHAEELGYAGVYLNDHFMGLGGDPREPYLEAWTTMTSIAAQTKRIKVGQITLFNSMRNPAVLAKMITTLDNITGGRYEAILGAGWNEPEYKGYDLMEHGRGMPSAGERVTRLKEAVQILRGMFDNDKFSYEGKYWKLDKAYNVPRPVNRIRLSVGARQPRMISIAAKYADGMNGSGSADAIRGYLKYLEPELEAAGRKMRDFYLSGFPSVTLTKTREEADAIIRKLAKDKPFEEVKRDSFIGTAEDLVEKFRSSEDLGMKMMIMIPRAKTCAELNAFASEFRDAVVKKM